MTETVYFDKYDARGAYHWAECDRRIRNWKQYNPALDARYELTVDAIRQLGVRGRLLDVGCGDGYLMSRVARWMDAVIGVDSEESAISLARQHLRECGNCEAIHTTCYDLPFPDASFEIVTSADVIEHLKDPTHHLREIRRVLKSDGTLVLTTPKWRADRKWDVRHEKEYRAEELRVLLREFFTDVELTFFWPLQASRVYGTALGWRVLKLAALSLRNPFLSASRLNPDRFGQILAICR